MLLARRSTHAVALHTEGVDRNVTSGLWVCPVMVALHTEGVDRNAFVVLVERAGYRRPPHGGRG